MQIQRRAAGLALLVWAAHLVVGVWHGASGAHRGCAPEGQIVPLLRAGELPCASEDFLAGALPSPPAAEVAPVAAAPAPAPTLPVAAPARAADVLAVAPKGSPPPQS